MDNRFADRYHAAALDPRTVPLDHRWNGVIAAAKRPPALRDLVRLAAEKPATNEEARSRFQAYFKKADPGFLLHDNDRELAVLAGATVSEVMATPSTSADATALLVRCAAFLSWRFPVVDLTTEASKYLSVRSRDLRAVDRPNAESVRNSKKLGTALDAIKAQAAQLGQPAWGNLFDGLRSLDLADSAAVQSALRATAEFAVRRTARLEEELDILWWLFSGRSRSCDSPWQSVPTAALGLIAATELEDLVQAVPGPVASSAFIARVLREAGQPADTTVEPAVAISAAPEAWRTSLVARFASDDRGDSTPLLTAFKQFTPNDKTWLSRAERASGLKMHGKRNHLELAAQMAVELELVRVTSAITSRS